MSLVLFNKFDEGSFGKIYLARKDGGIDDGKIYAVKAISSKPISKSLCRTELEVFKMIRSGPFLIQLKYSCKTLNSYNIVMDFIPGGSLFQFVQVRNLTIPEAKVCTAEIVLAIAYLHERSFVYRDLKLENVLVNVDGHILLTDFGLTRKVRNDQKLRDTSGTFSYFAPEMISGDKRHSFEVDWWSLGILMHEMLIGHSPFRTYSDESMTDDAYSNRILQLDPYLDNLHLLHGYNESLEEIIQNLLNKNPHNRLGCGQHGYREVQGHTFFNPLNWLGVTLKKYSCITSDIQTKSCPITYDAQIVIPIIEPEITKKVESDFHFVAPELQAGHGDLVFGSNEDDAEVMSQRIPFPDEISSIDISMSVDLYFRTTSAEQTIDILERLVIPKKTICSTSARSSRKNRK